MLLSSRITILFKKSSGRRCNRGP